VQMNMYFLVLSESPSLQNTEKFMITFNKL